ncbi:hypothetical protein OZK63_40785, partial [Streptomyces sp. UMAF16]|nr:hypothetical protein [Streptomyces sp. UMAF16]
ACFLLHEKGFESVACFATLARITKMTWMNQSILVVDDDAVVRELLNTDRFSTASTKLNGLIDKMVIDQTDLERQPMQTSLAN